MTGKATIRLMQDGRRLHLQHGPIDIVAEAFGEASERAAAYMQACRFFENVLDALVADLDILRQPVQPDRRHEALSGISAAMWRSSVMLANGCFVTPMAAVAGAVADGVLNAMCAGRRLDRAYVNNGGDIAIHLTAGTEFSSAIVHNADCPAIDATLTVAFGDGIGGLATSGWRGRSLSPGIADAVTVLAENAALADVAATLIAGAVCVDSPAVTRQPANSLHDDTDLGAMPVTTAVGLLTATEKSTALQRGLQLARQYFEGGLIGGAYLALQGESLQLPARVSEGKRKVA
jgi:hypothetical protein